MRGYNTYRHNKCLDMDLYVIKRTYECAEYFKVKVYYINRRTGDAYHERPETVKIYRKDMHQWKRL